MPRSLKGSVPHEQTPRPPSGPRAARAPSVPKEQEIYEVAARIFFEKGYAATRNQDVAEEVGMLKGSLYYYIDSKEDLLYGVMKMAYESLGDHLAETAAFEGDQLGQLRFFIVGYTELVGKNRIRLAVLEREMRSLSDARRREVIGWRDEYEVFLRDLLRAGQEAGLVRRTTEVEMLSILVFTQMHGLHTWYDPKGAQSVQAIAHLIAEFILHGIATG